MKKLIIIFYILPLTLFALDPYHEVSVGYNQDLGVYMGLRLEDSSKLSPVFIQGRGGYIFQEDPGNATEARKIFINDNAGGSVEKYGESYLIALDLGYKLKDSSKVSIELNVSGLFNYYQAHFAFIGNNESFAVKTSAYGLGIGGNLRFPVSRTENSLMFKVGMEYFPKTILEAHGTYVYTPDAKDDKPRNDYTYKDADSVINQPEFRIYVLVGLLYKIG